MNRKPNFFEGCPWFKFTNLGLVVGKGLKSYISVTKSLKVKARKFWVLMSTFVEVKGEKLVERAFVPMPNRVKDKIAKINEKEFVTWFPLKQFFQEFTLAFVHFIIKAA